MSVPNPPEDYDYTYPEDYVPPGSISFACVIHDTAHH